MSRRKPRPHVPPHWSAATCRAEAESRRRLAERCTNAGKKDRAAYWRALARMFDAEAEYREAEVARRQSAKGKA
jgi:hypothetical protein